MIRQIMMAAYKKYAEAIKIKKIRIIRIVVKKALRSFMKSS